ncbi:MAG: rod shape-determining protein RodA [Polyangiaceae bacterium]|nr:rod shape-determining protein RodA [Polyangiaceae bacterium]
MSLYDSRRRRYHDQFDWPLFLSVVLIAVIGVVNLYSATSPYALSGRTGLADVYVNQVYWLVVGGLLAILVSVIDYRNFERLAYVLYVGGVVTLLLVFVLGGEIRGSSRWIKLGSFTFQPSEFMKILVILAVAKNLSEDSKSESRTLVDLLPAGFLCALPVVLVMSQPDFGTSTIYTLSVMAMMATIKIHHKTLAALAVSGVLGGIGLWEYILLPYQKARVTSFLNPEQDKDAGWHALQSKTAIGNGGLTGEGFKEGTQNQFGFLPDQFSDFPFSVFAEDHGFVGAASLLLLYGFVCIWSFNVAASAKDRFGSAVAVGVGAMFFWHTFFNVGMAVGIIPVVGITLPLFSYGGSSVITVLVGFGLLMNISMRR